MHGNFDEKFSAFVSIAIYTSACSFSLEGEACPEQCRRDRGEGFQKNANRDHPLYSLRHGSFFPPTLIEISVLSQLTQEVFGPVLHLIRFGAPELKQVIDAVNATSYGLTLGIHSRIDANIKAIRQGVKVGNIYINRNMIGAVVGVQPFGGMGLSGTGPKAGGPDYLRRFAIEQTVTTNTAAIGGNASLLVKDLR